MPILTRDPRLDLAEAVAPRSTTTEALFAAAEEAAHSGLVGSALRIGEMEEAEGDHYIAGGMRFGMEPRRRPVTPLLTPAAARAKLRENGLEESLSVPETGIRSAALDILIQRKRDEQRRQHILRTADAGIPTVLAGAVLGSLVDPSNIALAFVPVVGEARYAALLKGATGLLGRTGVRVGVGAAEGLVGLAPTEALNYYANVQQQADYDAYDSMLAIAGGAFFGSALHAGAGLFPEALGRYRPSPGVADRLEAATPQGGAQAVAREVRQQAALDPAARERLMVLDRIADGLPVTKRQAEALGPRTPAEVGQVIDDTIAELTQAAAAGRLTPDGAKALAKEGDELEALVRAQDKAAKEGVLLSPEKRLTPAERALADQRRVEIKTELERHRAAMGAETKLTDLQKKLDRIDDDASLRTLAEELSPSRAEATKFVESLSAATRRALETDPFLGVRPFVATMQPETQAAAFRMAAAQMARGEPVNVMPAIFGDPLARDLPAGVDAARMNAGQVDGADQRASEWADTVEPLPDDIESARKLVQEDEADVLAALQNAGREMPTEEAEALATLLAQAKSDGSAAKAAALCMMRTGG